MQSFGNQSDPCSVIVYSNSNTTNNDTNTTGNNNDSNNGTTEPPNRTDIFIVVLVFLATIGCFIYFLCKCSSLGLSDENSESPIQDLPGGRSNNNNTIGGDQQVIIELGNFDFIPTGLIGTSVDLTLDQELSEDEGTIHHHNSVSQQS